MKRAMFLSCCGIATYRIFKELTAPAKSAKKKFSELVGLMKDQKTRKEIPQLKDFFFIPRNRKSCENISNYMADELRRLSQYCEYGDFLEEMLRD